MDWQEGQEIFGAIDSCGLCDVDFLEIRDDWVCSAVSYARLRTDWQLADAPERMRLEESRTSAHDRFIDACNILSRYMLAKGKPCEWRRQLGSERKEIGDLACFVHALLGIRAR